ncbi:MAG: EAL domain-containing protein [Lachnospiraceae bacterium]|nr:EAL domain-containing protein [Lachnospiraceae bacterium]
MEEMQIPKGLPGGFFIYNAKEDEELLYADENVIRLFGCRSMEEFRDYVGNSFKGMVYEEDLQKIEDDIAKQTMFGEKRHDYVRYRIRSKTGEIRYIEDFGHLLHGEGGTSFFYVFIIDVDRDEYLNHSRNSLAEAQILSMNHETDMLTGLWNMAHFYQIIQEKIMDPAVSAKRVSFLYFDIRNFKLFNERYGFQRGDELLYRIARLLWEKFPEHMVARFSDDHFAVCTYQENVGAILEDLHETVRNLEDGVRVELKAGVYELEEGCHDVGLACDHARLTCTSIKNRYDVSYGTYSEGLRAKLKKQQYVIDHLDEAIEEDYIKVFYQPVIRVATGEICGYEALARWEDPEHGMFSPADFIGTLEEYHLIHKLDGYIVRQVCRDLRESLDDGKPVVPVSLNLSRLDFELSDVFSKVEAYREDQRLPRRLLDIEITESALNENDEHIRDEALRFHDAGYQIWIDDFGSGYSSLNTLVEYTFDVLKMDMQFMRSFDKNPKTKLLLHYIVDSANRMGFQTLQEGVETEEHYQFLKAVDCVKAQGYYFGKPQPLAETRAFTEGKGMKWEKMEETDGIL